MYVAINRPSDYSACAYVNVDDHFHLEMIVKVNVIILGLPDRRVSIGEKQTKY